MNILTIKNYKEFYLGQVKFINDMSCGLTQGSILGPLLFIYINDLLCSVSEKCVLYVDDKTFLTTGNSMNFNLNSSKKVVNKCRWMVFC